jgi:plasmid stability protein
MPSVTIRGLDAAVLERIRARATQNGRSLEAELRLVLEEAAMSREEVIEDVDRMLAAQRATTPEEIEGWIDATRARPA